ncbi:MAG: hypothetical protein J5732_01390 [Bacteroidaceae bacterium]|nr:hypothetical protein [Bacteroidaceae bacterium]
MAESINGRQSEDSGRKFSLKQFLRGDDPRMMAFIRRQIPLIVLVIVLVMIYIGNRYDSQCDLVRIERMKEELVDVRYQALNITSDVSAKSKPSYIEQVVGGGTYGLQSSKQPPYRIVGRKKRR